MKFNYTISTKEGQIKKGVISSYNKEQAISELKKQNFLIISIEEKTKGNLEFLSKIELGRVSTLDKVLFAKHLSIMIKAGLPIAEALEIIKNQAISSKFKKILDKVLQNVKAGVPLSKSLAQYPKIFNQFFINMIKVGETSGTLENTLTHLSLQMEKDYELKKKIKGAMLYPMIIFTATIALGSAMAIFILPKLTKLFQTFKVTLPLSTRILLWISNLFQNYGFYIIGGFIVLIFLLWFIGKSNFARLPICRLILFLPIINKVSQNINSARFNRILGTLLKSGIPVVEALNITANTLGNEVYSKRLIFVSEKVEKGISISQALKKESKHKGGFPQLISQMIGVGEKTGKLDETLIYLAEFYEKEVDNTTKNLSDILEPILLIIIGLVVAIVAIAIITPIYTISGSLRK